MMRIVKLEGICTYCSYFREGSRGREAGSSERPRIWRSGTKRSACMMAGERRADFTEVRSQILARLRSSPSCLT